MKTFLTKLSALSLVLTLGLASCTEEDPITPGSNTVTNLSANSASSTSINARWEGGTAGDILVATANGVEITQPVTTTQTIDGKTYRRATISGLTIGTNYVLTVRNDDGTSAGLTWSPARRWPSETNPDATVQLWSTAAPGANQPSGLIIDDAGIRAVSTESADSVDIDIVLGFNDDPNTPVAILSPGVEGSGVFNGKNTKFANPFNVAGGLDNDFYTGPINTLVGNFNAVDISARASGTEEYGTSLIIPFQTADNHFGRLELTPVASNPGQVFGRTASPVYEWVEVKVSYQTVAGSGYVGRPAARGHWQRNATTTIGAPVKK